MGDIQILIADDEVLIARDLKRFIESIGYHVPGTAFSGKEIVDKAFKLHPDLVILDINLKGDMDGIEAGRQIRNALGTPLIYLTGSWDSDTFIRASSTSPCAYLSKPFDENEIQSAIHLACRRMPLN
ncbi:MAG: response regulator [Candidatus Xenobiia bacterium LiM19]